MKQFMLLLTMVLAGSVVFAQTLEKSKHKKAQANTSVTYTCTMHAEVTSKKPGKCPKCGMDLVKVKPVVYTCPMHPGVLSSKPGTCADCGMNLEVKKEETTMKTNL